MGRGDNRRSPKMRRRISQGKKKERLARRVATARAKAAAPAAKAAPVAAAPRKKAKKPAEPAPAAE